MKNTALVTDGAGTACGPSAPRLTRAVVVLSLALASSDVAGADTVVTVSAVADLSRMSIEELADIEISSVSKRPEPLNEAPAAIYVIAREDIRRSGATSIPEILRLAPNLQVARMNSSQYAITARGFNSTTANKLLVLIDGRSVYTPLYSGVFWDVQDVLIENIDRIEVISGPGGTLWGSNAVNGVINIIQRKASGTQGAMISLGAGNAERGAGARYGDKLGENATYRVYATGFDRNNTVTASGANVQDSWHKGQAGLRVDWSKAGDWLMLDSDAYRGSIDQRVGDNQTISGGHLLGRWNRELQDGAAIQAQAYYDRTRRINPGTFAEDLETYDIDLQHRFRWGARHNLVWGGGYRLMRDDVTNSAMLAFLPARRNLNLANLFVQDSITLDERLQLTLGVKMERNSYTGLEVQPNTRLAWKLPHRGLLWAAISRAVRTPSRLDRDFFVPGSAPFLLVGGPDFESEKLTAYEVGYRAQPATNASFSLSTFYNRYDDLRSVEPVPGAGRLGPFVLGNKMEGKTYGVEMWGSYQVNDRWRLAAGVNYLKKRLHFKADSGDTNLAAAGNDPTHQFSLRSSANLSHDLEFDLTLRSIGALPNPTVPSYTALDARLGWTFAKGVELSLTGSNLLDRRHSEFFSSSTTTPRSEIGRSFYAKLLWTF